MSAFNADAMNKMCYVLCFMFDVLCLIYIMSDVLLSDVLLSDVLCVMFYI